MDNDVKGRTKEPQCVVDSALCLFFSLLPRYRLSSVSTVPIACNLCIVNKVFGGISYEERLQITELNQAKTTKMYVIGEFDVSLIHSRASAAVLGRILKGAVKFIQFDNRSPVYISK